jgi:hypothetical protein
MGLVNLAAVRKSSGLVNGLLRISRFSTGRERVRARAGAITFVPGLWGRGGEGDGGLPGVLDAGPVRKR